MMTLDARHWAKRNLWPLPGGELAVRPGLRRLYTPESGRELVRGFSVLNPYTGEVWHYVFDVATSGTKALRLLILDEDFATFQTLALNVDAVPRGVSHAVIEGQIVIGSPDFPTLWGMVGSSVRLATKVASDNPNTKAIDVPRGICTPWCNRVVIGNGVSLYVSDPIASTGGSPRTFTAANQNNRPAPIFGVHEAAGGMLVVATARGTYGLDSAAATVGTVAKGAADWRMLNHHEALGFDSTCVVQGRVYGLTQGGYALVDVEDGAEKDLTEPMVSRAFGARISMPDYRAARILGADRGPIVAVEALSAVHLTHLHEKVASWWTSEIAPTDFRVRGLLRAPDGTELLLCANGVLACTGDFDGELALSSGTATQPKGVLIGQQPSPPAQNPTVREIHVSAAVPGPGSSIRATMRGRAKSQAGVADKQGITIGVDAWGTSAKRYTVTPLQSKRMQLDQNTDDLGLEVAADGCLVRLLPMVDIDTSASATERPRGRG